MTARRPPILAIFQASLRAHREAAGWSYAEMGRQMGVRLQRAHELETSDHVPSLATAAAAAGIFGKDLPEFLLFKKALDTQA